MTKLSILIAAFLSFLGFAQAEYSVAPAYCEVTSIAVANGVYNSSAKAPILFRGVAPNDGVLRVGSLNYFVTVHRGEVTISTGDFQSIGAGKTRILDLKNSMGVSCSAL